MMVMKRPSLRQFSWLLGGLFCSAPCSGFGWRCSSSEATLAIRPVGQGIGMPDGFSVWHHLDANGIRFKSITPQKDGLLIKFDSTAQGAAAKEVLGRALPHGYIIALLEDDNSPTAWLSRLRDARIASVKLPPDCVLTQSGGFRTLLLCLNLRESTHSRSRTGTVYPPVSPPDNGRYYP